MNNIDAFQEEATTTRTLRNIKNALKSRIQEYGKSEEEVNEIVEDLLKIHGLHKDNFDFVKNLEILITERLNDVSIDDNSNKNEKTMAGIQSEIIKPIDKAVGYDLLYRQMKEDWGKKGAKRLSGLMYDYSLAINDSSKLLIPYCFAIDATKIVFEGRPFGQLHSSPPNHVSSYIAALCETIHQMSNHLAGAISPATIFMDIAFIAMEREKITIEELKEGKTRKYIENSLQSFVHSVNHLSRNSNESAFTNVSIMDKHKLRALVGPDNYGWMFTNYELEHVVEYISIIQDIFLSFFDKGDPKMGGMPYRFPVLTLNISKDDNKEVVDKEFLDKISKTDIYRYNIFVSDGMKLASCCRLLNDSEMLELGEQTNSFGGTSASIGSHRVVTLNMNRFANEATTEEEFNMLLQQRVIDTAQILKSHKNLLQKLTDSGLQMFIKNSWIRMDRLFSTFGFIGIYEANITANEKWGIPDGGRIEKWLTFINEQAKVLSKKYGIFINIEQIPGESMAVRLADADKVIFGKEKVPFELYANQFIPLWVEANMFERMQVDGRYNSLLTGGGICHFNLGERVTPTQVKKLIKYAISCGSTHFALNALYCKCEKEHMSFGEHDVCPKCGSKIVDKLSRVVGFFTNVESWNKTRREWEFPRRKFRGIE